MSERIENRLSELRSEVRTGVQPMGAAALRQRAERQQRARRVAGSALAAVAMIVIGVVTVQVGKPSASPLPFGGTPSPQVTTSELPSFPPPSPLPETTLPSDDPMLAVDWHQATIALSGGQGCPSGDVNFYQEDGWAKSLAAYPRLYLDLETIAFGDVTGDGITEAVVLATCLESDEDSGDGKGNLMIVGRDAKGRLSTLAWAGPPGAIYAGFWVTGGRIFADVHPWHTDWGYTFGAVQEYTVSGDGSVKTITATAAYPPMLPTGEGRWLDFEPVAGKLSCHGITGPTKLRPIFDAEGLARDGDREWIIGPLTAPMNEPLWVGLNRDTRPFLFLALRCVPANADAEPDTNLVLMDVTDHGWRAFAAIPAPENGRVVGYQVRGDMFTVDVAGRDDIVTQVYYRWNGRSFDRQ